MRLSFKYNNDNIYYTVIYKKINDIVIQIEDGEILVTAPLGTSTFTIIKKVKEDASNIIKSLKKDETHDNDILKETNEPAESYKAMYLGKTYEIDVIKDEKITEPKIKLWRGKFIVETNDMDENTINSILFDWYVDKATIKINEKMKQYEKKFKELPDNIRIEHLEDKFFKLEDENLVLDIKCVIYKSSMDYILAKGLCEFNKLDLQQEKNMMKQLGIGENINLLEN
ncbi:hypothetical protein AN639_06065 [Candidatus Epulonipiscium fishelsonii]|uniref:Uncharacterized protein n=1 Tax=Candidatus Epulonipiscium fishelsonii TaxID=77094 RepID=A0ACC8XE22_9FIRM|nr:hypothetical protein AN639_06065 [Epulopiscium sp. SCG-B05WGA-EpuloA1]ONI41077.1 hypothetical protein AN396_04820 [Epulopiscium sp. SCG-B11WGA-EpuloA1]